MYHQVLHWAPNVEHLELYGLDIDTRFWRTIAGLSKLRTLRVHYASFRVLNPAMLSELRCSPDSLNTLLAGGPISTLETLTISSMGTTRDLSPRVALQSDFPPLLPNLRSLTCQFSLLFLASGRPLVRLHVLDDHCPPLDLSTILGSHGLNTITDLDIPSTIYLTAGHCFPQLRNLELKFPWFIDELKNPGPEVTANLVMLVDSCKKWAVSSAIQRLRVVLYAGFPLMDLALQHTMLTGSLSTFSALRWFQLGEGVEWERFAVDEAWRVLAYTRHRWNILGRFEAGDPCVVDYEDTFNG
ncbi:hypothetical protein BD779DRAFT_1518202 [Infundibulicybe gibba]|nr:hypothetical protein BD779DRAFT_1518202 [Infundibulicybe gibba]